VVAKWYHHYGTSCGGDCYGEVEDPFGFVGAIATHLEDGGSPLPRLSTQNPGARSALRTSGDASGDFFRQLGVSAILGRTFTAEDDSATCIGAGAVVSHAFRQREFGGDPGILGHTISLDGYPLPVLGVTPASFFGVEVGTRYDVAIPLCADRLLAQDKKGRIPIRHAWWLSMMGRLKPGWTAERATLHLRALSPGIMRATLPPIYKAEQTKRYLANKLAATEGGTGVSELRHEYESPLWLLMATTGVVLLIACANLAKPRLTVLSL